MKERKDKVEDKETAHFFFVEGSNLRRHWSNFAFISIKKLRGCVIGNVHTS